MIVVRVFLFLLVGICLLIWYRLLYTLGPPERKCEIKDLIFLNPPGIDHSIR